MAFIKEFKEFVMRGNVVDLAVGIIIGGAFGKIISSLVSDVLMPPLGLLMGGVDFADKKIVLQHASLNPAGPPEVAISYGKFINATIDFLIIAFAIFLMIKFVAMLHRKEAAAPAPPAAPSKQEVLLEEIRDLLKAKA
ncbi:MAG: large-conductance mechanosensitive channel protein MscL [Phycisphaerae bacterium]